MCILYAAPYNRDARGFYFTSVEEFDTKAAALRDCYGGEVEEFEVGYSDGDDPQLFEACEVNQCNLATWFDDVEPLEEYQKAALFYLTDCNGYRLSEALDKVDDVNVCECPLIDAATELFNDCYLPKVPEAIQNYIDYEAFARDCQLSGDMHEFELSGTTWTITNAGEV
jgi:hypothetical protein